MGSRVLHLGVVQYYNSFLLLAQMEVMLYEPCLGLVLESKVFIHVQTIKFDSFP